MSPTPPVQQNDGQIAKALKQLNMSASTLGFTAEDISAFLLHRSADQQHPPESKPSTPYHPAVLDPSQSKTTENNTYNLRLLAKDKFSSSSKKNKERFDRLDRILDKNGWPEEQDCALLTQKTIQLVRQRKLSRSTVI